MSVSRQVYNEAREEFFSLNKFSFQSSAMLSVFLIGIGPRNAMLLRSVWQKNEQHHWENVIPNIRQCLPSAMSNAIIPEQEAMARNAERYRNIVCNIGLNHFRGIRTTAARLVRSEMASGPSALLAWTDGVIKYMPELGRQANSTDDYARREKPYLNYVSSVDVKVSRDKTGSSIG
jgi:hypothetical protein